MRSMPEGATPHRVEVTEAGKVAILSGWITQSGTFVVADIDTVNVEENE